jgi:hypothetical protein
MDAKAVAALRQTGIVGQDPKESAELRRTA